MVSKHRFVDVYAVRELRPRIIKVSLFVINLGDQN
jgi:hypothetical protein